MWLAYRKSITVNKLSGVYVFVFFDLSLCLAGGEVGGNWSHHDPWMHYLVVVSVWSLPRFGNTEAVFEWWVCLNGDGGCVFL